METEEGDSYIKLILTGEISMVKSEKTGNFYATTRRCSISATFDEATAKLMVGMQMPGSMKAKHCNSCSNRSCLNSILIQVDPYYASSSSI